MRPSIEPLCDIRPSILGAIQQKPIKYRQDASKTERRISCNGCGNQTQDVNLPEIVSSEAASIWRIEPVATVNLH